MFNSTNFYQRKVNGITRIFNLTLTKLMKFQQQIQTSRNKIKTKQETLKKDDELLEAQEGNLNQMVDKIKEIIK